MLWLGPVESTPLKRRQLSPDVNPSGVFLVTHAVIPHVRARGGGSLVAVTTGGVGMTDRGANAYWVSKAAVERLYLGLAADLREDGISVNCLAPSRVVLTEGWQAGGGGREIPPEKVEPSEAMARATVLLAGQDATGLTGPSSARNPLPARQLALGPHEIEVTERQHPGQPGDNGAATGITRGSPSIHRG